MDEGRMRGSFTDCLWRSPCLGIRVPGRGLKFLVQIRSPPVVQYRPSNTPVWNCFLHGPASFSSNISDRRFAVVKKCEDL